MKTQVNYAAPRDTCSAGAKRRKSERENERKMKGREAEARKKEI